MHDASGVTTLMVVTSEINRTVGLNSGAVPVVLSAAGVAAVVV